MRSTPILLIVPQYLHGNVSIFSNSATVNSKDIPRLLADIKYDLYLLGSDWSYFGRVYPLSLRSFLLAIFNSVSKSAITSFNDIINFVITTKITINNSVSITEL